MIINVWFAPGMAQNIIDVKTARLIGFVNRVYKNVNILWMKFKGGYKMLYCWECGEKYPKEYFNYLRLCPNCTRKVIIEEQNSFVSNNTTGVKPNEQEKASNT